MVDLIWNISLTFWGKLALELELVKGIHNQSVDFGVLGAAAPFGTGHVIRLDAALAVEA
jgi:hypothetical protein